LAIFGNFRYVCYSRYVWYTSCILVHYRDMITVLFSASFSVSFGKLHLVDFGTLYVWYSGWYTKSVGSRFIGTPIHQTAFWHTRIVLGPFGYDWYSRCVWYTSCIVEH